MPTFRYQSIGADGAVTAGTLFAADRAGAVRSIAQRGETALTMSMVDGDTDGAAAIKRRPTISRSELADFIRELATAIEAGLPLMSALRTVHKQAGTPKLRAILDYIIDRVEAGIPLFQAAKEYGPPFDDMTVGMMRAADASGRTSEVLHQLADLLERSVELRREVVGAVIYPAMVAGLISVSVVIMIVFVLPRIMVVSHRRNLCDGLVRLEGVAREPRQSTPLRHCSSTTARCWTAASRHRRCTIHSHARHACVCRYPDPLRTAHRA